MTVKLFVSPRQHFEELVVGGLEKLQLKTPPAVQDYLVGLLEYYLDTSNLYPPEISDSGEKQPSTLAEMWLTASNSEGQRRFDLLKNIADRSLYISGFFSDSLQRKIVDVDYYVEMGGSAYATLAEDSRTDMAAQIYRTFSKRFVDFVDVLSYISQKSMIQSDQNVLRLYDRYLQTGSEIARERLIELGVMTLPFEQNKKSRQ